MMYWKSLLGAMIVAAATSFTAQAVMAAGEDTSEPPKKTKTTSECTDGKVWDAKKNACVNAKKSDLSDDILFQAARELAYAGQYENSIKVLGAVKELREFSESAGGSLVVVEASPGVKSGIDAWGAIGSSLDLMERIKSGFDPGNILNPGRLF